jgi:hypothetical protein
MSFGKTNGDAKRRRFTLCLLLAYPSVLLAAKSSTATPSATHLEATLAAYLDTLLPRDEVSPSASDLGLHRQILAESRSSRLQSRLIRAGCHWLDQAAEGSFTAATPEVRVVIVSWMSTSAWDQIPRRFYEILRQRVIELYYARTDTLGGLPIRQPPQPDGYPQPWA